MKDEWKGVKRDEKGVLGWCYGCWIEYEYGERVSWRKVEIILGGNK